MTSQYDETNKTFHLLIDYEGSDNRYENNNYGPGFNSSHYIADNRRNNDNSSIHTYRNYGEYHNKGNRGNRTKKLTGPGASISSELSNNNHSIYPTWKE